MLEEYFHNPFHPTILQYVYEGLTGYSPAQYFAILLPFLMGLGFIDRVYPKAGMKEKLFLAFPIGMATQTFLMFFMLLLGIELTQVTLSFTGLLFLVAIITPYLLQPSLFKWPDFKARWKRLIDIRKIDLVWLIAVFVTGYVLYGVSLKTVFWPTFDNDAINSFELYGKAIARESSFVNSVVLDHSTGKGIPYPPFVPLGIAYFLKFGFLKTKIFFASLLISFVLAFYAVTRHFVGRVGSALITMFMIMTPEVMAFAALTKTNVVQMEFAALGFLYLFLYFKKGQGTQSNGILYLATILLAYNAWSRSEGIEFLFIGGLALIYHVWSRKERYTQVIRYAACILPFLFWQIFLSINHHHFEHVIQVSLIKYPYWDGDKFYQLWHFFTAHMKNTQYFGITFYAFLAAVLLNFFLYPKRKERWILFFMILGVLVGHFILMYQFRYPGGMDHMIALLKHSLKRYYFTFIPLIWFYIGTTPFLKRAFDKYENAFRSSLQASSS